MNASARSIVAGCAAVLVACGPPAPPGTLRSDLAALRSRESGAVLDLAHSVPAAWDTVIVLTPYASPAAIDSALGFTWRWAKARAIGHQDTHNLLVFVRQGRAQYADLLERSAGDFCCITGNARYARASARFEIHREGAEIRLRHAATR